MKKKKRKVQSHKYGCFLTVSLGAKSWYHSKLPHLSLINIYTRWAAMNANLFAFFSLLTSPWAEGSWEKVCRLTGSEDISVSQPSGILISGGESSFHPKLKSSFCSWRCSPRECSGSWGSALSESWCAFWQAVPPPKDYFSLWRLVKPWTDGGRLADLGVCQTFNSIFFFFLTPWAT